MSVFIFEKNGVQQFKSDGLGFAWSKLQTNFLKTARPIDRAVVWATIGKHQENVFFAGVSDRGDPAKHIV